MKASGLTKSITLLYPLAPGTLEAVSHALR